MRIWKLAPRAPVALDPSEARPVFSPAPRTLGPARLLWPIGVPKESVAFSPDGQYAFFPSDRDTSKLILWSAAYPGGRAELAHERSIMGASCSPDSKVLITFARDGMLKLWDLRTARLVNDLKHRDHVNDVRFAPDGASFLSLSDGAVQLWETATGEPLLPAITHADDRAQAQLIYPTSPAQAGELIEKRFRSERIVSVAFSSDGSRILTRSADGRVRSTDISLDAGSLDEWRGVASRGLFPPVLLRNP